MSLKRLIAIISFAALSPSIWAQVGHPGNQSTTVPDSARFELVQSSLLARVTLRLDRFTGQTWQLVSTNDGSYGWQLISRDVSGNDVKTAGKANYQIFLSGLLAKITLLMNMTSGATWYITEDAQKDLKWVPVDQ